MVVDLDDTKNCDTKDFALASSAPDSLSSLTPVMQQYIFLREKYSGFLLLYKLGDFYELFFEDAVHVSALLGIVLTSRGKANGDSIPMCGIPVKSLDDYLRKLVNAGYKVAISDQLELPEQAKKRGGHKAVIHRDVVRVVTPGTIVDDALLEKGGNHYLLCLVYRVGSYFASWIDLSTGDFFYSSFPAGDLKGFLYRIAPRELLISESLEDDSAELMDVVRTAGLFVTKYGDEFFELKKNFRVLCDFYDIKSPIGLGIIADGEVTACGALVSYVISTQRSKTCHLPHPSKYDSSRFVSISSSAVKSLELFRSNSDDAKVSFFKAVDFTVTPGGCRMLRQLIAAPFASPELINNRYDLVEFFVEHPDLRSKIRKALSGTQDHERSLSRINVNRGSPKDLYVIARFLDVSLEISSCLMAYGSSSGLSGFCEGLGSHCELADCLSSSLLEDAAGIVTTACGGYINPEFNPLVRELTSVKDRVADMLRELRDRYRKSTGMNGLKIMHNNILGYYIEVGKSIDSADFIFRQGLSSCVRYTTNALMELEGKIVNSCNRLIEAELRAFEELCGMVIRFSESLLFSMRCLSELDLVVSFAELAVERNYVRPIVDYSHDMVVKDGRHPVLDAVHSDFVPNTLDLSCGTRVYIITGPNMAGKSTYLRQNALIAIMAHIGSFVPASEARIGLIDRVFSRVGASDSIADGYSTFMLEMVETAEVLNCATNRSLIVLDEVGRGTSFDEGLAIARAVLEYILLHNCSRALFATHYHQLYNFLKSEEFVQFFYMKISECADKIVFLYELVSGVTYKSYGVHIAALSGFPDSALRRVRQFLDDMSVT